MNRAHAPGHRTTWLRRRDDACQACGASAHHLLLRVLLPPLTIILVLLAAGTLLAAAVLLVPPLPQVSGGVPAGVPAVAVTVGAQTGITTTTLGQIAQVALPRTPAVVDLARLIYAPGDGGSARALPGPLLLVVDAGVLTVHLDGPAHLLQGEQAQLVSAGDVALQPGDGLLLPQATAAAFRNRGAVPAVALVASVVSSGGGASLFGRTGLASWNASWSPGATVQPLAGGWIGSETAASATLTVQRLIIPSGESHPLLAPGPVDLAVETGVLTLQALGGLVWQQPPTGPDQAIAPLQTAVLLPGDAALLQEVASVTLRNDSRGPLVLLALSVTLDRDGPAAPQSVSTPSPIVFAVPTVPCHSVVSC